MVSKNKRWFNRFANTLLFAVIMLFSANVLYADVKKQAPSISGATHHHINIPSSNLATALNLLAKQTQALFLFPYDIAATREATSVAGKYTILEALDIILHNTGLASDLSDKGVIEIFVIDGAVYNDEGIGMNSKKNLLASTIAFFVGVGGVQSVVAQEGDVARSQSMLEEVIVTASKRGAGVSIQDTAMAISALDGETIDKRGLVGMDDYLRTLPGVSFQDRGAGQNSIVIRGLATNPQVELSTSSAYFGEAPISGLGSASQTGEGGNADIKLVDIERIEVLRGPQGTLYGSGAMAGTVRIIPNSPNLDQVEGSVATRLSQTGDAGGDNNMIQGVINIPLIENELAIRAVAYRFENSGYIENVAASQPNARITDAVTDPAKGGVAEDKGDRGNDEYTGFRLTTLWKPSDELDVTFSYVQQDIEQDGWPEVNLDLADDNQQRRLNIGATGTRDEYLTNDLDMANLVINYDFGWATLTSASTWIDYGSTTGADLPNTFLGNDPFFYDNEASADVVTEELRLSSALDGSLQFVTGLYYDDRDADFETLWKWSGDPAFDPYPLAPHRRSHLERNRTEEQIAAFGELTYSFSDQVSTTVGARHFDYEKVEVATLTSRGVPLASINNRRLSLEEKGQIYKAVINYAPSENILIYGSWSEGFRLGSGGQNQTEQCTAASITVGAIKSDQSENIELGIKTSLADNRITLNAALFSTGWDDLPVRVTTAGCGRFENGGKATSEGLEVELQAQLTESLRVDVSASYVDGTLDGETSIGKAGDPLPGSADVNVSAAIQYDFSLISHNSFVRLDYSYVGEYFNNVEETGTAAGDFNQVNLILGMDIDQMSVNLFANNLTNENGLTWVETNNKAFSGTNRAYRIRPRTIGLNLSYHF